MDVRVSRHGAHPGSRAPRRRSVKESLNPPLKGFPGISDGDRFVYGNQGNGIYHSHLQAATFSVIDDGTCTNLGWGYDATRQICTGPVNGPVGTCAGDSGGPYFVGDATTGYFLAGVHSWGTADCAGPNIPVRLSAYADDLAAVLDGTDTR